MPCLNDLHGYQHEAVDWICETPSAMLMLDMGLGKTVTILTALQRMLTGYDTMQALIVAPKRVAQSTWPREIDTWDHINMDYSLLMGTPKQRKAASESDARVHIINIDNLLWLIEMCVRAKCWPYDTVIIDESSMFKNHGTRRFRSIKRVLPEVDRVILATGTPAPNSLIDLWPQIYLLDQGERLFRTITSFRTHYCVKDYNGFSWSLKAGAEEDIYQRVGDLCLRMDAGDYLDTPERVDVTVPVALPPAAMARYQMLERDFMLRLSQDEVITAPTAATLAGKLLQAANGAVYVEDKQWQELHTAKIDALGDILEAANGQPVLVAYNYKHDLERLLQAFPEAQELNADPAMIDAWNDGDIPLLLAHPQSAGHGLNLQHGGSILVWFSITYSLEQYQQFNARLHRQGQKNVTVVHHLVGTGTIDELVMEVLAGKDKGQNALLNALKDRAQEVLHAQN